MQDKCPTCKRGGKPKSKAQQSYYWAVIVQMISDDTGNDPESVHSALKMMFLPRQFVSLGEKGIEVAKSTKELSTSEAEDYYMRCRVFAGDTLGITIPNPNEAPL